ncbi:MAG: LolA family protein [Tepidisphaeraceae bacterium]
MRGWKPAAALTALACALFLCLGAGAAQTKSNWTLEDVLKQLDHESKNFRSLTANIERTKVTVVVNDKSVDSGRLFLRRDDKMLIELTHPDPRTILRTGDDLFIYSPKLKRVEEYDIGKHRAEASQFLLLGFGSSGGDLKKNYLVTLLGEDALDKKKTLLLELTPKSDKFRTQIAKIHLWIDAATWLPIQQKFFETGSGDYFVVHFTNIVRNPRLADSQFKPNWPKGTQKIKPQG